MQQQAGAPQTGNVNLNGTRGDSLIGTRLDLDRMGPVGGEDAVLFSGR
jgi:hypothetical protein